MCAVLGEPKRDDGHPLQRPQGHLVLLARRCAAAEELLGAGEGGRGPVSGVRVHGGSHDDARHRAVAVLRRPSGPLPRGHPQAFPVLDDAVCPPHSAKPPQIRSGLLRSSASVEKDEGKYGLLMTLREELAWHLSHLSFLLPSLFSLRAV